MNSFKRGRLIRKIILKHRSSGWTSCLVYVKYSAKVVVLRNRQQKSTQGRKRRNKQFRWVSDVVTGPKTFSLNNAYVDASTAVTCGRRLVSIVATRFFQFFGGHGSLQL